MYDQIPGVEVPLEEPILLTYYVTKWVKEGEEDSVPHVDFNICWAGVLVTGGIQDPILETPIVRAYDLES